MYLIMENFKIILKYLLCGIILSAMLVAGYYIGTRKATTHTEYVTDTLTICDTITDLAYDTVYFSHFDSVYLPVVINDTILQLDSVMVQVPISTTIYDTTIQDTVHTTHIRAHISGFATSLDSLTTTTIITHQEPKIPPKKWYDNFGIGAGIMYGTGGFGLGVGIMYKL